MPQCHVMLALAAMIPTVEIYWLAGCVMLINRNIIFVSLNEICAEHMYAEVSWELLADSDIQHWVFMFCTKYI